MPYSPSKAMSYSNYKDNNKNEDKGDIYLRDLFLTREEYKEVAGSIKDNFPLKL